MTDNRKPMARAELIARMVDDPAAAEAAAVVIIATDGEISVMARASHGDPQTVLEHIHEQLTAHLDRDSDNIDGTSDVTPDEIDAIIRAAASEPWMGPAVARLRQKAAGDDFRGTGPNPRSTGSDQ